MAPNGMMAAFPPAHDRQVTLANWRQHPFMEWSFHNVRQIVPTAAITRSATPLPLPVETRCLDDIAFDDARGARTTLAAELDTGHIDGLLVLHRGRIVSEHYRNGFTPDAAHIVFSVSKSIAGAVGGILAEAGKLDPDAPVTQYIPEVKDSVYRDCTVRHLLDMTVGIRFVEDYMARDGDIVRYRRATGWDVPEPGVAPSHLRDYLTTLQPDGTPHGKTFHYVSTNTDLLGWVYERACAMPYAKILSHYLWQPLGAEHDGDITVDTRGAPRAAGGISVTLRDLARFGEMMRNHGISNGRQVVPSWWIDDIRTNANLDAWGEGELAALFPNGCYRSKWYIIDRSKTAFAALGIHGQWIYVDPQAETVIVQLSSRPLPIDLDVERAALRRFAAIAQRLTSD